MPWQGFTMIVIIQKYSYIIIMPYDTKFCMISVTKICTWYGVFQPQGVTWRWHNAGGGYSRAAGCLAGRDQKKAPLGFHICGMKWLASSQIECHGKGRHKIPCTHNFICSLLISPGRTTCYSCLIRMTGVPVSQLLYIKTLCHPVPVWVFKEQVGTREVLDLVMA